MLSNTEMHGNQLLLTKEESDLLEKIYRVRLKLFVTAYFALFIIAFWSGIRIDGESGGTRYRYAPKENDGLSRMQMYCLTIPTMELFVFGMGIALFFKRILPLKKDIKNNIKETIYYFVIQKQEFPNTGQYFIGLNHPDYLFHEVSFDVWSQTNIGDTFGIFRAPISKYVFNPKGRYTIM